MMFTKSEKRFLIGSGLFIIAMWVFPGYVVFAKWLMFSLVVLFWFCLAMFIGSLAASLLHGLGEDD